MIAEGRRFESYPVHCTRLRSKKMVRTNDATVDQNCLKCGKFFTVKKYRVTAGGGRYCSRPCAASVTNMTRRCSKSTKSERLRANGLINMRIRRGVIKRPLTCEKCSKRCKPDAHHEDYSKPDDVSWLCRSCHNKRHFELGRAV